MDWNWFFSSLAQSTAAIVGLFGAFIITKIINNEKEYKTNTAKIENLLHQSSLLKKEVNFPFFENDIDEITKDWDSVNYPYVNEPLLKKIDSVNSLLNKIENHLQELNQHYKNVSKNQESSALITLSIILILFLYWGGVHIPLSLIQTPTDSLFWAKIYLLPFDSVIFTIIFIIFRRKNLNKQTGIKLCAFLQIFTFTQNTQEQLVQKWSFQKFMKAQRKKE